MIISASKHARTVLSVFLNCIFLYNFYLFWIVDFYLPGLSNFDGVYYFDGVNFDRVNFDGVNFDDFFDDFFDDILR